MEANHVVTKVLIGCGIVVLLVGCLGTGFLAGRLSNDISLTLPTATPASTQTTEQLFKPFWEAWQIVHDQYLVQPVDDEKMMQGAIRGMMDSLGDPHSGYMSPSEYSDAMAPMEGYSGIGAWVSTEGALLTITEPMKG